MRKFLKMTLICSVLVLFATSSFAQHFMGQREGRPFRRPAPTRIYHILKAKQDEFKITDSQLEKIKTLTLSFEEKMISMRSEISKARLELKKLMLDEESKDYGKIQAVLSEISQARQNTFMETLKVRDEIHNVLTPEQRDAIKDAVKDRFEERGFRHEKPGMRWFHRFRQFPER